MTRKEDIIQAAINKYSKFDEHRAGFIDGALWADNNPKETKLSAADRGAIDEVIIALKYLENEKMMSFYKEIEALQKIRKY